MNVAMDVTSYRASAVVNGESRSVHVEAREDLSAVMKAAGIKDAGYEMDTVLILLDIDGNSLDVIATDDPHWTAGAPHVRSGLYEQLVAAREALDVAIEALGAP